MNIDQIQGIDPSSQELLEAAGFNDVRRLAQADPGALHRELVRANDLLRLRSEHVPLEMVGDWVCQAAGLMAPPVAPAADEPAEAPAAEKVVDYEQSPEVLKMLAGSPFALPLPARVLMEQRVSVSSIPAGIMLNSYVGDLDVRVNQTAPAASAERGDTRHVGAGSDVSGIEVIPANAGNPAAVASSPTVGLDGDYDRQTLLRTPRKETNLGKNPESRWYIRGVLYREPVALYFAGLITLGTIFLLPASIVSALLLILSSEWPDVFGWVPTWLLFIPAALPLVGFGYLIWGIAARCMICSQKLFVHGAHHTNLKAHHVKGLGHILPLCLHMLVFRWFRCTHCGTAVRLKE